MTARPLAAAWISGAGPNSGVGRVGAELTTPLRHHPDFRKLYFNGSTGRLEESGAAGTTVVARGRTTWGKSLFALSLANKVPRYRAAFIDSQNLAFLRPRCPACLFVHDLFYWTHPRSPLERLQGHLLYRGIARYEAVLVNSEYTRAQVVAHTATDPARITVVPLGFDRGTFHPAAVDRSTLRTSVGLPGDARVVFHLSSGEPRKNLPRLMRAFARVAHAQPDVFFVKGGGTLNPGARNDVLALAAALGVEDRVRVLPTLDETGLADWYRACDVFALPSLAEGFGLPVLEAQACGTRVVTSSDTALGEIAGPLCDTADPRSEDAIQHALATALGKQAPSDQLLAESGEWLARFSWEPGRAFLKRFMGFGN